jgi:hypothetical protein
MDIPCWNGNRKSQDDQARGIPTYPSVILRGTVSMTLGDSNEPALKGSIPVNHLNNNEWIPKGTVRVHCQLTLDEDAIEALSQCQNPFPPAPAASKQA